MRNRESQQWTEFVRKREERKDDKPARRRRRSKQPQPTPAELEAALDDLTTELSTLGGLRREMRGVLLPVVYRPPRGARSRELLQLARTATMLPARARPPLRWSAVMRLSGRSDRLRHERAAPSAGRTRSTVRLADNRLAARDAVSPTVLRRSVAGSSFHPYVSTRCYSSARHPW